MRVIVMICGMGVVIVVVVVFVVMGVGRRSNLVVVRRWEWLYRSRWSHSMTPFLAAVLFDNFQFLCLDSTIVECHQGCV